MNKYGKIDNFIKLEFDKSSTRLAGNPFGRSVYQNQVANKIEFDNVNIIEFPDNIVRAASSFVQGFFFEVVYQIGYEKIKEQIIIKTIHEELKKDIYDNLMI